jgi:sulfoxide reductase catalytic subunit YedY
MANLRFRQCWDRLRESEVTSESVYINRRSILKSLGCLAVAVGTGRAALGSQSLEQSGVPEAWSKNWEHRFPARQNNSFEVTGGITDERIVTGYNNFYEFSRNKTEVRELVGSFRCHPWEVKIKGEISKRTKLDLDDLIRICELEERIYHFRCVEAFSMNVPWTGYPFRRLVEYVQPNNKAKWIRFKSVYRPRQMPGQMDERYPWPYTEVLSMEEALNELSLLTFGLYGHPLNKQNGAPLRLVLPWKYGFKSIKSISEIEFLNRRPRTFWMNASREYGFWGNVNPRFRHARWSQETELFLTTQERIPTQIYNGYGEYVSHLYDESEKKYFY